jgi:hypothetical protein
MASGKADHGAGVVKVLGETAHNKICDVYAYVHCGHVQIFPYIQAERSAKVRACKLRTGFHFPCPQWKVLHFTCILV